MKHSKYEKNKDSGIAWLGDIPEHWKITKAKQIWQKESRPIRDEDEIVTAFRDGEVTLRKNRREDGFTISLKEIGYQGVRKDDLVIHQMDAFAGAIGVSDSDGKCTPVYSVCTPKIPANPHFYNLLLREMSRSKYILSLAKGIRERSTDFRFNMFGELEVPLLPKQEQTTIANFLDYKTEKINRFIKKKKQLIKLLNEQKAAIINKAVTKGLEPNAIMKDSGIEWLGKVPEHWKLNKIKNLISKPVAGQWGKEVQKDENDIVCLRVADFKELTVKEKGLTIRNIEPKEEQILKFGDLLIEKSGGGE
ncbi:MAG: hypothetical protein ABF258_02595, partial [Flavobacteriales bacterium]